MTKIRVKVISLHQPNEITEMEENKAYQLAKIGCVEILDGEDRNKIGIKKHSSSNKRTEQPISRESE